MSTDLTKVDESRPEGLSDRITDDPRKQRLLRQTLVDNFGAEHHLTGEHKFPNGAAFDAESAKSGQLYFHDDGVLMLGKSVFPIGASREFLWTPHWVHGGTPSREFAPLSGVGNITASVDGLTSAPFGYDLGLPTAGAGFNPPLEGYNGYRESSDGMAARLSLNEGIYTLDGVLRYYTGSADATNSGLRISMGSAGGVDDIFAHTISGFALNPYTAYLANAPGRVEITPISFDVTAAQAASFVELMIYGPYGKLLLNAASGLSVIGITLSIRRVA